MSLPRDHIESALRRKGFVERQGDHRFFFFQHEGLTRAVFTYTSRGSRHKTVSDDLVAKMARQLKLRKAQFLALVDCEHTQDDYAMELIDRGIIRL